MKWLKRGLLGIAGIIILVFLVIYAGSEYVIKKKHVAETRTFDLVEEAPDTGEGERLARVFGCYRGCHGKDMEGDIAFDEPPFFRAVAPMAAVSGACPREVLPA
jgi:hypothetical protein